ncbi:MAG: hypothetical protein AAB303_01700, partial [Chloroflexota bacterium]
DGVEPRAERKLRLVEDGMSGGGNLTTTELTSIDLPATNAEVLCNLSALLASDTFGPARLEKEIKAGIVSWELSVKGGLGVLAHCCILLSNLDTSIPHNLRAVNTLSPRPNLSGKALEEQVKAICRMVLESPEIIEREIKSRTGVVQCTQDGIRKSLVSFARKNASNVDTETNLALEKARGNVSQEAYERALARVKAERTWITEERQRLETQNKTLEQGQAALLGFAQVRERLAQKLATATIDDWRMILNALGAEVHVTDEGTLDVGLAIPLEATPIVSHTPGGHPQTPTPSASPSLRSRASAQGRLRGFAPLDSPFSAAC